MSATTTDCMTTCIAPAHVHAQSNASAEWMMLVGLFLLASVLIGHYIKDPDAQRNKVIRRMLGWMQECVRIWKNRKGGDD